MKTKYSSPELFQPEDSSHELKGYMLEKLLNHFSIRLNSHYSQITHSILILNYFDKVFIQFLSFSILAILRGIAITISSLAY